MIPIMTLGEFREATKDLPDDAHIILHEGDLDFHEASIDRILPPVLEHPYAIGLVMGQPIGLDLDMDARLDASFL